MWDDIPTSGNPEVERQLKNAATKLRAQQAQDEQDAAEAAARREEKVQLMEEAKAAREAKEAAKAEAAATAATAKADGRASTTEAASSDNAAPLVGKDTVERVVTRQRGDGPPPSCPWCG